MQKIYFILFFILEALLQHNLCMKDRIKVSRRKNNQINNNIDNFDIMYKKKLFSKKISMSKDNSVELGKYIYAVLDLFDFWEMYNDTMIDFNNNFILFFKDFFGIRLIQKPFYCNVKKQLFIDGLIEKIIYFYQTSDKEMRYKFQMKIDYFNSFKFDVLYQMSSNVKISIITIEFLLNLFFNNKDNLLMVVPALDILHTNDYHENDISENRDTQNLKKIEKIEMQSNERGITNQRLYSVVDNKVQLIADTAELGLLNDSYLYNVFSEYIIQALKKNNFLRNLYIVKDIFLDKYLFDQAFCSHELFLKKLNSMYCQVGVQNNSLNQAYLNWLVKKEFHKKNFFILHNEDYLFVLFLTIILYYNIDYLIKDHEVLISESEKKLLKDKYLIARSILDELSILSSNKKIDWIKIAKIKLNKDVGQSILSILLDI